MDYDDVIEKDKRTFLQYFFDSIKEKQLIINTFFITNNVKPRTIKIISFLLQFDLYLLFNGLMFSDKFLIELYKYSENSVSNYISKYYDHLLYIYIIIIFINKILECFFIKEKRVKSIFIRNQNKFKKIKQDVVILIFLKLFPLKMLIKKFEKYYFNFIIVNYIIFLFSFIYVSCFNDVYYYIRYEWLISTLFFFVIIQLISATFSLIETIIRFISIKYKSETIFKFGKSLF